MNQAPSMLKPALISGIATGFAGTVFVVFLGACAQCTCCVLIAGCGFLAAYLYSKDCQTAVVPFGGSSGATIGLMAGLIYGLFSGGLGGLYFAIFGMGDWQEAIEMMQDSGFEMDPSFAEQMSSFMEGSGPLVILLILVFASLLFGAIFATIGGLIGGSVFKYEPGAAATDQAPPPPPVG